MFGTLFNALFHRVLAHYSVEFTKLTKNAQTEVFNVFYQNLDEILDNILEKELTSRLKAFLQSSCRA